MGSDISKVIEDVEKSSRTFQDAFKEMVRIWASDIVFTWRWWIEVGIAVLPWVFWFVFRKKEDTHRLLYGGFVMILLLCFFDMAGMCLGLWDYPFRVVPFIPQYFSWDFTAFPVIAMYTIQFDPLRLFRRSAAKSVKLRKALRTLSNPWVKGTLLSLIASFVVQPVAAALLLYDPKSWRHYYSLPMFLFIYMAGWWFYSRKCPGEYKQKIRV
jgi:hypothetical protein